MIMVFDGKTVYGTLLSKNIVGSDPSRIKLLSPWDINQQNRVTEMIQYWRSAAGSAGLTVTYEKGQRGEKLLKMVAQTTNKWKSIVWLLVDQEYAVHKTEEYNPDGHLLRGVDQCTYEEIGKRLYPAKAVWTTYTQGSDGKPTVQSRQKLTVDSIETNPEKIPDTIFRLEFPKNQPIYDLDTNTQIADPKAIQEHLDRLADEASGRRFRRWWPAAASISAVAVGLVGVVSWRRWRKPEDKTDQPTIR